MNRWRLWSLPSVFVLLAGMFIASSIALAQAPAPKAKQLKIGCYTYSGSVIWTTPAMATWYAQRYNFAMGSDNNSGSIVPGMKTTNPQFKALVYDLFVRYASDTVDLKSWCTTKGYDFNTMVLRVAAGKTVTVRADASTTTGFGRFVTTVGPNVLLMPGFTDAQTRFCWDFRNPKVGEYLAYRWKQIVESMNGFSGAFVDEEGVVGYSNVSLAGLYPIMAPFRDTSAQYWQQGSPFTSLTNNWGSFDINGDGQKNYSDVLDSLARARDGWMRTAGNLMKSYGYFYAPNFAATPTNSLNNWIGQGRHCAVLAGSYINGEYSYFYPGADGYELNCNNAVRTCYDVRDSAVNMFLGWTRMGQYDREQGKDYERSKMNGLGFWLDCSFPGTTQLYVSPCVKNGQVDYYMNRAVGSYTEDDSTVMWGNAWGKYFGVPLTTRDTATKGTDGGGQAYTVHKISLMNPSNLSQLQTLAVGRYARGANFDTVATGVTVNLGGSYIELKSNGTYGAATSSTKIGNAQWKVFVVNTALADNGPGGSSGTDSIPPSKVNDLGVAPGTSPSQLVLSWTAPGNDGAVGTAFGYDIGYSVDSITAATWVTSAVTHVGTVIAPAASGTHQTVTLTTANGLLGGTKYWVALKAYDAASNYAALSNVPAAVTNSPPPSLDTIPPARVIDLGLAPGAAPAQLVLTWTAPGNNGSSGRATGYEIGYSTDSITDANWSTSAVTQVGNLVVPATAGTHQALTLTATNGVLANTKYWVGLKAFDSAGNYAALSNRPSATTHAASATDTVPPARVTDLACSAGPSPAQLVLGWTAPGNNGAIGTVAGYEVGYSLDSITDALWPTSAVNQVGYLVTPVAGGSHQSLTLTADQGLLQGTKYWVGLKAFDSAGNYAPLSNVSSASTSITIETGGDVCIARPLAPANGALLVSAHPVLTVQNTNCAEPGPHTYFFQVAQDTFFTNPASVSPRVSEGTQLTSWTVIDRLAAGHYFWRVQVDTFPFGDNAYFDLRAQTIAFPNPVSLSKAGQVTFSDLPQGSNLLITSVTGDIVKRFTSLPAGDIKWNALNESGNIVSPGTYLWYLENSSARGKIVILP